MFYVYNVNKYYKINVHINTLANNVITPSFSNSFTSKYNHIIS